MNRLSLLIGLSVLATGCSGLENAPHPLVRDHLQYGVKSNEHRKWSRVRKLADQNWAMHCGTGGVASSPDYAQGFKDGFADQLYYGGPCTAPSVPPKRYWNDHYRSPAGYQAIQQWYAGFREGAYASRISGQRQLATIPSDHGESYLAGMPQYAEPLPHRQPTPAGPPQTTGSQATGPQTTSPQQIPAPMSNGPTPADSTPTAPQPPQNPLPPAAQAPAGGSLAQQPAERMQGRLMAEDIRRSAAGQLAALPPTHNGAPTQNGPLAPNSPLVQSPAPTAVTQAPLMATAQPTPPAPVATEQAVSRPLAEPLPFVQLRVATEPQPAPEPVFVADPLLLAASPVLVELPAAGRSEIGKTQLLPPTIIESATNPTSIADSSIDSTDDSVLAADSAPRRTAIGAFLPLLVEQPVRVQRRRGLMAASPRETATRIPIPVQIDQQLPRSSMAQVQVVTAPQASDESPAGEAEVSVTKSIEKLVVQPGQINGGLNRPAPGAMAQVQVVEAPRLGGQVIRQQPARQQPVAQELVVQESAIQKPAAEPVLRVPIPHEMMRNQVESPRVASGEPAAKRPTAVNKQPVVKRPMARLAVSPQPPQRSVNRPAPGAMAQAQVVEPPRNAATESPETPASLAVPSASVNRPAPGSMAQVQVVEAPRVMDERETLDIQHPPVGERPAARIGTRPSWLNIRTSYREVTNSK